MVTENTHSLFFGWIPQWEKVYPFLAFRSEARSHYIHRSAIRSARYHCPHCGQAVPSNEDIRAVNAVRVHAARVRLELPRMKSPEATFGWRSCYPWLPAPSGPDDIEALYHELVEKGGKRWTQAERIAHFKASNPNRQAAKKSRKTKKAKDETH